MHKQLPRGSHRRSSRFQVVTKAAENSSQQELDMSKIGTIPFYTDEESIQDVFAFDGPAPEVLGACGVRLNDEARLCLLYYPMTCLADVGFLCLQRVNGRTAMIAFVGAAAAEAATGKSVLEQAAAAPLSVLIVGFLISIASIFPKYASGVPLARLLDSAGGSATLPVATYGAWVCVGRCSNLLGVHKEGIKYLMCYAGRQGLPRELAFFNKTHEIWLGRVAM